MSILTSQLVTSIKSFYFRNKIIFKNYNIEIRLYLGLLTGLLFSCLFNIITETWYSAVLLFIEWIIVIISTVLLSKRFRTWAVNITSFSLIGLATSLICVGEGARDVALLVFPSLIVFGGLSLNRKTYFVFSIINILSVIFIFLCEIHGFLITPAGHKAGIQDMLDAVIILTVCSIAVDILINQLKENIIRVKKNEIKLKQSELKYKTLSEITYEGVAIIKDNKYIESNKVFLDMLGYSIIELRLMKDMLEIVMPEFQPDVLKRINAQNHDTFEVDIKRKDITGFPAELKIRYIDDETYGEVTVFSLRDITDRKKSEAERLRLQSLESLGILAGGIAHDFNNLLTAIMGQASLIECKTNDDNIRSNITGILTASKRSIGLTQQLLTFAKGGKPQKSIIEVKKIIEDTTNFSLSGSNINVEFEFNDIIDLEADQSQFTQLIQNIVINAKQSMTVGGKIKISAENIVANEIQYLKINISDSGCGISKENLDQVFVPYFSTKPDGTGLGLAVCFSIVKKHEGSITIDSQINVGTTVHIFLPASVKRYQNIEKSETIITPKQKILIMDDEEYVRDTLKQILEELGHDVTESKNGNEAIELYKSSLKNGSGFDLVFLDLTIKGGMGGMDTLKMLIEFSPGIKSIVSSGYSDSSISDFKEAGFCAKLNKPYSISQVNEVIYNVIGK